MATITICLPTADRPRAHAFYAGLGFGTPGEEIADDGVPEPLRVALGDGCSMMLIPTGGFGWVSGGRPTAPAGTAECVVSVGVADPSAVDELAARVPVAGGEVVAPATRQPWGEYSATFADPDGHLLQVSAG